MFKKAKGRGADQYKNISLDDRLTVDEAKTMYRVITGACQQGTEQFITNLKDNLKEDYSVREIIDLTKGQYGSKVFTSFFDKS